MSDAIEKEIKNQAKSGLAAAVKAPEDGVLNATFEGTAFAPGDGGLLAKSFRVTVKIPRSYAERRDITPIGIFVQFFEKTALKGCAHRMIALTSVEGQLPEKMRPEQRLMWTCDREGLIKLSERFGKGVYDTFDDNNIKTSEDPIEVVVHPEFYPDNNDLCDAILRCMKEPQAFEREQKKRAGIDVAKRWQMERELAALNKQIDSDFDLDE